MKSTRRPVQADGRVHGVVAAVRRSDGRWLMIRRSASVPVPLRVCFPGGAVEAGESQEQAISREVKEELGVEVRPIRRVWRWDSPAGPLTLWGWVVELQGGEDRIRPDPDEIAEVLWLEADEGANRADGLPTNALFIEALKQDVEV